VIFDSLSALVWSVYLVGLSALVWSVYLVGLSALVWSVFSQCAGVICFLKVS